MKQQKIGTGTTVIGMIYDKGVLLLADTQVTTGLSFDKGQRKIYPIDDSMAMAASGLLSLAQIMANNFKEQIDFFNAGLESLIQTIVPIAQQKESTQGIISRIKGVIEPYTSRQGNLTGTINPENIFTKIVQNYGDEIILKRTQENSVKVFIPKSRDIEGNLNYSQSSLLYQIEGKQILINVTHAAELLRELTVYQTKDINEREEDMGIESVLAGYDREGPKLFKISPCLSLREPENGFVTIGSGMLSTTPRLNDHYRRDMKTHEAMLLATYAGLKAAEEDMGTNDIFNIYCIEKNEGLVAVKKVEEEHVNELVKEARRIKVKFPFKKKKQ